MKLIHNWRDAPKWYSVWAGTVVVSLGSVGAYLTPEMLAAQVIFLPDWTYGKALSATTAFFGVTGLIGRMIYQPPKVEPKADE